METENKDVEVKTESRLMHPLLEIEKAFDHLIGNGWPISWRLKDLPTPDKANFLNLSDTRIPKLDVINHEKKIVVRAEVPGINKKDIDVSLSDNILTIKGETTSEKKEEGEYHTHEISSTSFARSVALSSPVIEAEITAALTDGVLEVTLPKAKESKKHPIDVK